MRGGAFGRLLLGHGGVEIADLVGHANEFLDLVRAHAASPPSASFRAVAKQSAWSARATAIRVTPKARALSSASEVGAESDDQRARAENRRLGDHLERAAAGDEEEAVARRRSPARQSAPIALSSALWRPTSSRTSTMRPSRAHQAAAWTARVSAFSGWRRSSSASAAPIAAGASGGPDPAAGEARASGEMSSTPQRPQPVRPAIARLRARCALQLLAGERDRDPPAVVRPLDLDAANVLDAIGDPLGQRKAVGEVLEIAGRRHHHREGRRRR